MGWLILLLMKAGLLQTAISSARLPHRAVCFTSNCWTTRRITQAKLCHRYTLCFTPTDKPFKRRTPVSTRPNAASCKGSRSLYLRFFNSLGALAEFSDNLVEYAYDRQILCDPERQAYYFECLQVISESRNTEQLQMKVATLQSQDVVSRRDVIAAYRFFNIQPSDAANIDNARIIEIFQAQQPDLGAAAQEDARAHLYKLGVARQSSLLINASRQSVDTYADALSWLGHGVDQNTSDEGILAVLAIRVSGASSLFSVAPQPFADSLRLLDRKQSHQRRNRPKSHLRYCLCT